jgi:hypothetical protein
MTKSKRIGWTRHVERTGEKKTSYEILKGKLEETDRKAWGG